jgi:hypothetical protein
MGWYLIYFYIILKEFQIWNFITIFKLNLIKKISMLYI